MQDHSQYPPGTAARQGLALCQNCHQLTRISKIHCDFCGSKLALRKAHSLQNTLALLITSMLLYIPANLYPIMVTQTLQGTTESTIIGGVILFFSHGSYLVASIIFLASVFIPLAKMLALFWLCYNAAGSKTIKQAKLTRLFVVVEWIGKWSMIDVFVVALMVALVQMGSLMSITPGTAALAFCGVVIVTMLAAHQFDSRLLWDKAETNKRKLNHHE